jgi:hypothetical protein
MSNYNFSKYYYKNNGEKYTDTDTDEDDDDDEDTDIGEDEEETSDELQCKNIDPALAKLMGIFIEEQKTDWKPPLKSGLVNSSPIISSTYFYNQPILGSIDFFKIIKDDIINYKKLTDKQLDYIKNLNNQEKYELIEIYNKVLETSIKK